MIRFEYLAYNCLNSRSNMSDVGSIISKTNSCFPLPNSQKPYSAFSRNISFISAIIRLSMLLAVVYPTKKLIKIFTLHQPYVNLILWF
jgi:hypothetical protein